MKFSRTTYSVLGFLVPLVLFLSLGYIAIEYSWIYALLGGGMAFLFQAYRLLMQVPRISAFVGFKVQKGAEVVAHSEKTAHFFSGVTVFYFILISPFVAVVLYSIWALYLSKLF